MKKRCILALWALVVAAPQARAEFFGVGDLPGDSFLSVAFDVSADGRVVVGVSDSGDGSLVGQGDEAFRWTREGGMVGLGDLNGEVFRSRATGVSDDGSVISGQGFSDAGPEAMRWSAETGMVGLGFGNPGFPISEGVEISGNGQVTVGQAGFEFGFSGFRHTDANGMENLGALPVSGGDFLGRAWGTSFDGSVTVGEASIPGGGREAVLWNENGILALGDLPGGFFGSAARDVTPDGTVIVGGSVSDAGTEGFRWTAPGGMVGLGNLPGGEQSTIAKAVSADGTVVVGTSAGQAVLWDESGIVSLFDLLADRNIDISGWQLLSAEGVSADGFIVVGEGINPRGSLEGWYADLTPLAVPEPTSLASLAVAGWLGIVLGWRRRRRDSH